MESRFTQNSPSNFIKRLNAAGRALLGLMTLSFAANSPVAAEKTDPNSIAKEWRSAMLISHPYSTDLDQAINAVNLSVDNNNQAVFEVLSRATKENQQPNRILWTLEVEPETKFFLKLGF